MPIDFKDPKRPEICQQVINKIEKLGMKFVRLQFTDINGILKSASISTREIKHILEYGQGFDGSSITGFGDIEESDLTLVPDPTTFASLPWRSEEIASGRFLCDIYNPDGTRYDGDPRYCLEKAVKRAESMGYKIFMAPELEFFILSMENGISPEPMDLGGYFSLSPGDRTENLRREICDIADHFGITVEMAHHEVALGQNEIDFKYGEALETADRTVTLKMIIKAIASKNDFVATFMPKPFFGINGSGMHVHQSVWTLNGENAFYDENKTNFISDIALNWIGGQLKYGREMSAILASWPNSYKRLIPGYEAPVYVAWGHRNRSPLIRVPDFGGRKSAARAEIRCPDPAGNPYLQFAVLIHAGLEGIEKKISPPTATDANVYKMNYEERKEKGIISLPESLAEALNEMKTSDLIKKALGDKLYTNFLKIKFKEWDEYRIHVTQWEVERYIQNL
ncbi:MAG: glutamine synthetase family protein [Candidatus Helarchaeota archaeon]